MPVIFVKTELYGKTAGSVALHLETKSVLRPSGHLLDGVTSSKPSSV